MMDPALRTLMRLQTRAAFRRALRGAKTPKGALFLVIGALVFVGWLAPTILSAHVFPKTDPHLVRLWAPLILLALCAATLIGGAGDRVISFTPGEINFLFPGPFTRRELMIYKLARTGLGALFSGTIISFVLLRHATSWPAAFFGGILAMLLVQFLTLAVVMTAQVVGERAYSTGRKIAAGLLLVVFAVALMPAIRAVSANGWHDVPQLLDQSTVSHVVLSPLAPFVRTFTAGSFGELVLWAIVSAAIDFALLLLIFRLDADYREASLAASQRVFDRLQRFRRGQASALSSRVKGERHTRIGMFPFFGGAGPTAWRQLTATLRTSRGVLIVLLLIAATGFIPLFVSHTPSIVPVVMMTAWGTMFLTMMLRFDFRAELDQMEWLKALPLGPTATAAGQLAIPTLCLTAAQALLLGAAAVMSHGEDRFKLLLALPMLLPFNLLLMSIENLMFLLFPSRVVGAAPGDLGVIGRQIVFFIAKMLTVFVAAGLAGLCALLAYFVTRQSIGAAVSAGFVVLSAIAVSLVPVVGLAYKKFDPSRDAPA
jgi:hypothetical protein